MSETTMGEIDYHREVINSVLPVVQEASELALSFQKKTLAVEIKHDGSPVSEADQAIEAFLLDGISQLYPDDGFEGEESTIKESMSGYTWRVDPIDGTIQYLHGQEFWAILLGREDKQGNGVGGVIAFPARDEIIHAAHGSGCWEEARDGKKQLHVSTTADLSESYILHNGIAFARKANRLGSLTDLLSLVKAERGYADAFGHVEIARGRADAMVDFLTEPHDVAAVRVAIAEAGGHWSALDGSQVLTDRSRGSLTTNGALHEIIRSRLAQEDT